MADEIVSGRVGGLDLTDFIDGSNRGVIKLSQLDSTDSRTRLFKRAAATRISTKRNDAAFVKLGHHKGSLKVDWDTPYCDAPADLNREAKEISDTMTERYSDPQCAMNQFAVSILGKIEHKYSKLETNELLRQVVCNIDEKSSRYAELSRTG